MCIRDRYQRRVHGYYYNNKQKFENKKQQIRGVMQSFSCDKLKKQIKVNLESQNKKDEFIIRKSPIFPNLKKVMNSIIKTYQKQPENSQMSSSCVPSHSPTLKIKLNKMNNSLKTEGPILFSDLSQQKAPNLNAATQQCTQDMRTFCNNNTIRQGSVQSRIRSKSTWKSKPQKNSTLNYNVHTLIGKESYFDMINL
eukprot:TRINITY_DN30719_c0_g1_i2.p1 TRINITY_DN30719_c0_g1~~TRINITY_DN30719_c0_g1_i2.p1  ORF type:complete len:196 (+),score=27.52 TRINITY_DN30719_c0_g1_i2:191-778(+)